MPEPPSSIELDALQMQRTVRAQVFQFIALSVMGAFAVYRNISSFDDGSAKSAVTLFGKAHTIVAIVTVSALTVFQFAVVAGILRRSRLAWRAAFAVPVCWFLTVGVVVWPQVYKPPPGWSVVIPYACLAGMGYFVSRQWWRMWKRCEAYFGSA